MKDMRAAYTVGYRHGWLSRGEGGEFDPRYTEGVIVSLHNAYVKGYEDGGQCKPPGSLAPGPRLATSRRPIGITREGLGELIPFALTPEDPRGDEGDGRAMAIIMEHAEVASDMGLVWDAVRDYDLSENIEARATRYDVQYVDDEPGEMGWINVRAPDYSEGGGEAAYDLYILGEHDLDNDELTAKYRREGIQRRAAALRANSQLAPGLRARRKELGLTQVEAARGAGITPQTLGLAERGKRVSLSTVQGLARALETSAAALTGEGDTEDP